MPIEIKELVIRAVAVRSEPDQRGPSKAARTARAVEPGDDSSELVQACVKEVLRILRAREGR